MESVMTMPNGALVDTGASFGRGSSGKWAGEQFMKALRAGQPINSGCLRTADTLRKDEWKFYDEVLVEEAQRRLRFVADLRAAGLVKTVANGLGKTIYEFEKVTDMGPAKISMTPTVRTDNDVIEFDLSGLPLPVIHKDWWMDIRKLMASRSRGESLDTTQTRMAGRVVAETVETLFINGAPLGKQYAGLPIYGLLNFPQRNQAAFGAGGAWTGAKTGEQILTDVLTMIAGLKAQRMFGPYWLYVSTLTGLKLEEDFKTNSDKTIRQRLLELEEIQRITTLDFMDPPNVAMIQPTIDVIAVIDGEPFQTIQWDTEGGFVINFKAMTIQIPLIRADIVGRSGIFHMS